MTTNPLTQALLSSLNKYQSQLHAKRIWLACSGGRDSLSLAAVCCDLYDNGNLPFLPQLLHVNHGMQDANDAWATQVQAWAHEHNMNCQTLTVTLGDHSEQSARLARYDAMQSVMNSDDVLMLGHHSDDQVETVLMRLFNGAGVKGLGGMQEWTAKQYGSKTIYLWRPWLTISRAQITNYATSRRLDYIDDPTNVMKVKDDINVSTNDRAWLRSVLMPVIHERYPQASDAIARSSQLMQDASRIINDQIHADLSQLITSNPYLQLPSKQLPSKMQSVISIDKLLLLSSPRQSAIIHHWLSPTSSELSPSQRLVNDVLALCQRDNHNHQTCLYWNNNHQQYEIRRYKDNLYRLHSDWMDWLALPPLKQRLRFDINFDIDLSNNPLKGHDLKSNKAKFRWQFHLLNTLKVSLAKQLRSHHKVSKASDIWLCFEPLPRDIKLSLAGRAGRKSGKKLLQAIDQPAFMRESVVLVSINFDKAFIPLFIIAINGIHPLQSPYTDIINALIESQELTAIVMLTD